MKKILVLLVVVMMVSFAQASVNLLVNGDFTLGEVDPADGEQPNEFKPVGWGQWNGGGWNKREINPNGLTPENPHLVLGNAGWTDQGAFQFVAATEGLEYKLSVDAGSPDSWWKPNGEVKMEFLDAGGTVLGMAFTHWAMADYDTLLEWQNYSTTAIAPVGTVQINALLMNQGQDGGSMRFDNAVLEVVPEPATLSLIALGGLFLRRRKA